ncbi:glycosyltransferase [Pseudomonas nitroreducens]|uniref:Glycosyltransferase family 4 protein n=1 Tax=Pseudomonas nitroreducens TaxID=46680 RepID=A0A6G6ITV7_PSENT|nr:glycosyltransferase [Pseudomonas nitroreducens]QIE86432.1 glycosyltransferase family 4 protein [Pseudomonas nitroreducens]
MKITIFRGLPLSADSRTTRYGSIFEDISYCTWEKKERSAEPPDCKGLHCFPLPKDGGWTFVKYPLYLLYLFIFTLRKIDKDDLCICMDLDTYVPVLVASFIKRCKVVFDVVDPASQARFKKLPFGRIIDRFEYFLVRKAFLAIFPIESRLTYYKDRLGLKEAVATHLILENIPNFSSPQKTKVKRIGAEKTTLGYFGTLDSSRGLELLLNFASENPDNIDLIISGDGPLASYINEKSSQLSNIKFLGKFSSHQLPELYAKIDYSWMYYCPEIYLHKYAAPNKFYEHLCFSTPAITNSIIPQSDFINKNRTGIVIDRFIEKNSMKKEFINEMRNFKPSLELEKIWDEKYKEYYSDQRNIFNETLSELGFHTK